MWATIVAFFNSIFGGKGVVQIGKGQQSASTTGTGSPVLNAGGNINYSALPPVPTAAERDSELLSEVESLMPELIKDIRDLLEQDSLLRDMIVMECSTFVYNWPTPHGMFANDKHPDAVRKFQILESHGLVRKIKPIAYQLSPRFVRMLKEKR